MCVFTPTEDGVSVVTPILYGPLHTKAIHSVDFFTKVDSPSSTECRDDLISATCQVPNNANMPQAHAAIFLNVQGIVGCLDPILLNWLTYSPTVKTPPRSTVSSNPRSSVASPDAKTNIDKPVAEDSSALNKKPSHGSRSDSNVTVPTGSHTQSQSHTQTYNNTHASSRAKPEGKETQDSPATEAAGAGTKTAEGTWGHMLAKLYPLIKIIQVQVGKLHCVYEVFLLF